MCVCLSMSAKLVFLKSRVLSKSNSYLWISRETKKHRDGSLKPGAVVSCWAQTLRLGLGGLFAFGYFSIYAVDGGKICLCAVNGVKCFLGLLTKRSQDEEIGSLLLPSAVN